MKFYVLTNTFEMNEKIIFLFNFFILFSSLKVIFLYHLKSKI